MRYLDKKKTVRFSTYGAGVIDYELDPEMFPTNIKENNADEKLSIYPNPVRHTLNIENNSANTIESYCIYDLNGRVLQDQNWDGSAQCDVSQLLAGRYIINFNTSWGKTSKQFIKE